MPFGQFKQLAARGIGAFGVQGYDTVHRLLRAVRDAVRVPLDQFGVRNFYLTVLFRVS